MKRQRPIIRWKPIRILETYYEDHGPGHAGSRQRILIPAGGGGQVKGTKQPPSLDKRR